MVTFKSFIVLLLILGSGAVFFQEYNHIGFVFISFVIFAQLLLPRKSLYLNENYLAFLLLLSFTILLTMVLNNDLQKIFSYLNLTAHIIIPFLIPILFDFKFFARTYTKLVVFLSFSSLIIFFLILTFGNSFLSVFPRTFGLTGVEYYNLFLYVVEAKSAFYGLDFVSRNNSIFWEPGAFQGFLTLGLILEIYYFKSARKINIFILVAASLSTFSTTGYIVLIIFILFSVLPKYIKKISTGKLLNKDMFIVISGLLVFIVLGPIFFANIADKFEQGHYSTFVRIASTLSDFSMFLDSPIYGNGISRYSLQIKQVSLQIAGVELGGSNNSLTHHLAMFGLLLIIPLLGIYAGFSVKITDNYLHAIVVFVIVLITHSTQDFFCSLIWLTVGFYGLHTVIRNKLEKRKEFSI